MNKLNYKPNKVCKTTKSGSQKCVYCIQ